MSSSNNENSVRETRDMVKEGIRLQILKSYCGDSDFKKAYNNK